MRGATEFASTLAGRATLRLLAATLLLVPAAQATELIDIRSALHPDFTRVVLELSDPAPYQVVEQSDPSRIEVAVQGVDIDKAFTSSGPGGSPVREISIRQTKGSDMVLILALSSQVTTKTFFLGPEHGGTSRIVLDLYRATASKGDDRPGPGPSAATGPAPPVRASDRNARHVDSRAAHHGAGDYSLSFSGTWDQEWAVNPDSGETQKFESLVQPRVDIDLPHGTQLTAIARIRLDTVGDLGPDVQKPNNYSQFNGPWYNDKHAEVSLREFYVDAQWGPVYWRLGKQQVVWGQADGIKVMDVVNPQSYREFILDDFDDSRIPLWTVNAELPLAKDASLQFLWIPDTTYHELAEEGTPYVFTSPLLVPQAPAGLPTTVVKADKPDNPIEDSDAGVRYSDFLGGWDITLNYLYRYLDFPVPYQELSSADGAPLGTLLPEYKRSHLLGGTLSNVFGDVILRAEFVYNSDTYQVSTDLARRGIAKSPEFASVIGADWQLGASDTLISAQWFQSHLTDFDHTMNRTETENNVSLLLRRSFANETWVFDALALYSVDRQDRLLQLKLSYLLRSNLELWLGSDLFGGDHQGYFGQYSQEDRILLGLEYGF